MIGAAIHTLELLVFFISGMVMLLKESCKPVDKQSKNIWWLGLGYIGDCTAPLNGDYNIPS